MRPPARGTAGLEPSGTPPRTETRATTTIDLNENGELVHYGDDGPDRPTRPTCSPTGPLASSSAGARDSIRSSSGSPPTAPHRGPILPEGDRRPQPRTPARAPDVGSRARRRRSAELQRGGRLRQAPRGPALPPLTRADRRRRHDRYAAQLESLRASTASSASSGALRAAGELDRHVVVFTSDNGFLRGEHRPTASSAVRGGDPGPAVDPRPRRSRPARSRRACANVDLAPTLLEAAGAEAPDTGLTAARCCRWSAGPGDWSGRELAIEGNRLPAACARPRYIYVALDPRPRPRRDRALRPRTRSLRASTTSTMSPAQRAKVERALAKRLRAVERCAGKQCQHRAAAAPDGPARLRDGSGTGCHGRSSSPRLAGKDTELVLEAGFSAGRGHRHSDRVEPFRVQFGGGRLRGGRGSGCSPSCATAGARRSRPVRAAELAQRPEAGSAASSINSRTRSAGSRIR